MKIVVRGRLKKEVFTVEDATAAQVSACVSSEFISIGVEPETRKLEVIRSEYDYDGDTVFVDVRG